MNVDTSKKKRKKRKIRTKTAEIQATHSDRHEDCSPHSSSNDAEGPTPKTADGGDTSYDLIDDESFNDGDDETEEPIRKKARLEKMNVDTSKKKRKKRKITTKAAEIQATRSDRDEDCSPHSSPNDAQGDIPKVFDGGDTIVDSFDEYLKDPSQSGKLKILTVGDLRENEIYLDFVQQLVTIDLRKALFEGIIEDLEPNRDEVSPEEAIVKDLMDKINDIVANDHNEPFVPEEFQHEFVGNKKLVKQVKKKVREILRKKRFVKQVSFAFIHTGASGVGKTFTAVCLSELLQKSKTFAKEVRFVLAYIGFNVEMSLTSREKNLIEEGEIKNKIVSQEERIHRLILSRLILTLKMMIKHHEIYKSNSFKKDSKHAQPMMPIKFDRKPYKGLLGELHQLDVDMLREEVRGLCFELTAKIDNAIVIVINLDEAQKLDDLVRIHNTPQGARFALRILREMQQDIYSNQKGACLLLPIATGINPATSLSDDTHGRNIGVNSPILNEDDFKTIGEEYFSKMDKHRRLLLIDLLYPRVRDLIDSNGEVPLEHPSDKCENQDAMRLLVAGLGGERVERSIIPRLMGTRDSIDATGAPILDAVVWPWLRTQLDSAGVSDLKLPIQLPFDVTNDFQYKVKCSEFESMACQILAFTLDFFGKLELDPDKISDYEHIKLSIFFEVFNHVEVGKGPRPCRSVRPVFTRKCHQPFSVATSHKKSRKSPLNEKFVHEIKKLKVGASFLYECGGSAMLDYILVYKRAEPTDGTNGELVMRYGDSKHSKVSNQLTKNDIKVLKRKARKLHKAITERVPHDVLDDSTGLTYSVSSNYNKVFIITNSHQEYKGIFVLSPKTFQFPPWTTVMFNRPSSKIDQGAVLSSLPK